MSDNGTIAALAAVGVLAALSSKNGSRSTGSVEQLVERPRSLYDAWSGKPLGDAVDELAALELEQAQKSAGLGGLEAMFGRFTRDRMGSMVLRRLGLPEELSNGLMFRGLVDYVKAGKNSFVVGPKLQAMFEQTSIPKVESWMINPPYSAFWIALPECQLKIWGIYNTMAAIRGVMVDMDYKSGHMALNLWAPVPLKTALKSYPEYQHLIANKKLAEHFEHAGNDSFVVFNIHDAIHDPRGIEEHILDEWSQAMAMSTNAPTRHSTAAALEDHVAWPKFAIEESGKARVQILKIVLGTLLYLQSDRQDLSPDRIMEKLQSEGEQLTARIRRTKNKAKIRKMQRKLDSLPSGPVSTWLGRKIEEGTTDSQEAPADRRTMRRHWVRGHWRRPARKHGPRVLRWIQPFQRGGGEAVTSRTYTLEQT